ncbi:MAG: cobalamin-binding protein [Planctomycetaceae bacterium]|nr:cobalamin-binding protein [Planctomycetaceae bacterium]
MKRIVSLLPAATEMVVALGCGAQLVGRSHECDYPAEICKHPVCTRSRLVTEQTSGVINQEVNQLLSEGSSLFQVDFELIKELQPDVVITQAQCEVCAICYDEVACELAPLLSKGVELISVEVYRLADLWKQMRDVAQVLRAEEAAEFWIEAAHGCLSRITEQIGAQSPRRRVACIEWFEPLMAAGNWVPELVELAGGVNLLSEAGAHSPWMKWEAIIEADPEVIVLMPCGFDLKRSTEEAGVLLESDHWSELRAVQAGQVYVVDGSQYFNRPGPRLIDSIEILAEIFHPERIAPDHEGVGWCRL